VPANLAEGCGRETDAEFVRFCQVAFGSANELDYHLLLSKDLGYLSDAAYGEHNQQVIEVKRMLSGLMTSVRSNSNVSAARARQLTTDS
jgi:four helix bundle protein